MTRKVWDEGKEKWCPLSSYEDTIFDIRPTLTFVLQDHLQRPKRISVKHDDGSSWSHHQFVDAVANSYLALARAGTITFDKFGKLVLENAAKRGYAWHPDVSS
jgi:hypothetical protein